MPRIVEHALAYAAMTANAVAIAVARAKDELGFGVIGNVTFFVARRLELRIVVVPVWSSRTRPTVAASCPASGPCLG